MQPLFARVTDWIVAAAVLACVVSGFLQTVRADEPAADAPRQVQPESASKHVGETCAITFRVRLARRGDSPMCFLNSEADFRNDKNFTVVIFEAGLTKFKEAGVADPVKHFDGKKVRVTGKVEQYRGRPQIRVDEPKQLEILVETDSDHQPDKAPD